RKIALLEQRSHLRDKPLLHTRALLGTEGARLQEIAVGTEGLVGLLKLEQLHRIAMTAPIVEVAHETACLCGVAVGPQIGGRQTVHEGMARDGQELLAAAARRNRRGRVPPRGGAQAPPTPAPPAPPRSLLPPVSMPGPSPPHLPARPRSIAGASQASN